MLLLWMLLARRSWALVGLGVDLGTSGVRVCVVEKANGVRVVGEAKTAWSDDEGREPEVWLGALRECLGKCEGVGEATRIAVSGTSASLLAVEGGAVSRSPMMYCDSVDAATIRPIEASAPAGHVTRSRTSALGKLLAWNLRASEVPVHQADYVAAALASYDGEVVSGPYRSDWHNALKLGFDVEELRWPEWVREVAPAVGSLGVVRPGEPTRTVSAAAAAWWGAREGARIVGGTTDSIAAYLACSATEAGDIDPRPGEAVTSLGSTTALKLVSETRVDDDARGVYSHRLDDRWLVGGASNAGCRVLRAWMFDDEELADLAAKIEVDAHPVNSAGVYPLVSTGERFPVDDPDKEPRLPDFYQQKDRRRLLEMLLLGISDVERLGYKALRDLGATDLVSVRTAGGGAKNKTWRLMRERMLGVPVYEAEHTEASFGAALLALRHA
ncbi:hypothetical protein CTAYLR_002735 [Chrysophaeum taylorii]|uniref:Carbohydrate kinase FGGY C-terminal domain-containing protein n=1 Tax=Chrysophaeum taylorii TaxID=2483200 RepID=A0AAD7XJS9_9STRA|nr:hypothetical protein CTAYLR_002735 [Chrysophaeum taylorii]